MVVVLNSFYATVTGNPNGLRDRSLNPITRSISKLSADEAAMNHY